MEDYGVAKGYIDLDISKLERAVQTGVRELDNLDRKSALVESEFNRMQSAGNKVGGVFQQAAQKSKVLAEQIAQSKSKCELYNKEIGNLNTIIGIAKEKQGELTNKIKDATSKYEQSKAKVDAAAEAHGKESKEYENAVRKSQELKNGLNQLESQYDALDIEVEQSEQSIAEFKTKLNNTEASINVMNRQLAESQNKVLLYGQAWQGAGEKLQAIGDKINGVGNKLSIGITAPAVAAGTASVKLASDATTSFAKVSTIADSTVLSYSAMEKGVTAASDKTGVAITDFNEALYQSLSAGVDSGKAIGFTTDMVKLAKGGFTDTAKAVDVVTSVLNAYGLSADEATSISDKLIKTQNIGKTTVDELASSLGRVIPTAKAVNVDMDNVSTAMAILTKRGIQTAEATTYYNSMLNELGKSGTTADKALRDVAGKGFKDLVAEGKPVTEILQMVDDYAKQNGLSLSDMFGSMEAGKAALSIMSDGGKEYNEVLKEMQSSAGTTQQAFEKMDSTPAAKMQKELNRLKNTGIKTGQQLLPLVTDAMKAVGNLAEGFGKLPKKQQGAIVKTVGFAAALGPVLKVTGGVTKGVGGLTKGFGKLIEKIGGVSAAKATTELGGVASAATKASVSTGILSSATAALASPIGIVTIAMGALAGGVYLANKADEARIERLSQLTGKEKELSDAINQQYESYTTMAENRTSSLAGIEAEYTRTQNLSDELRTLVDENGKVKSGNEDRASFVVNELSSALGQEITITDGVIQKYGELCGSIDEAIRMKKAFAIQEALQDDYVEAVRNKSEAQKQYNEELKNVETYERKLKEAKEAVIQVDEKYKDANMENKFTASQAAEEHAKAAEQVEIYSGKLENSRTALKKAEESYIGYSETIQNYEGLGEALANGDAAQVEMALVKIQEHFLTAETATKESLEQQKEAIQTKYKEMQEAVKNGAPGVTQEAVDAMGKLAEQSAAELNAKTEQEKTALTNMFCQCGIEAPQGLIDALVEKSPEAQASLLEMLNTMSTGTALKKEEIKNLFGACGIESADSLSTMLAGKKPQVQAQALDLLSQVANGAALKKPELNTLLSSCGIEASTSLLNSLDGKKPEVQMKAIDLVAQLQTAESSKRGEILSQLSSLGVVVGDNLSGGLKKSEGTVKGASNSTIDTLGNATKSRIDQITPGFQNNLKGMAKKGVSGMEKEVKESKLPAVDMKTPDWKTEAKSGRKGMQNYLDDNPLSITVNMKKGSSDGFGLFADGGIATEPAIFGESGPEMAIPLSASKRTRALSLYKRTGELLGINQEQYALRTMAMDDHYMAKNAAKSMGKSEVFIKMHEPDYDLLTEKIVAALRKAPIEPQVTVQMQDGDVYIGEEKAGRKLAPVISRIISQNT